MMSILLTRIVIHLLRTLKSVNVFSALKWFGFLFTLTGRDILRA